MQLCFIYHFHSALSGCQQCSKAPFKLGMILLRYSSGHLTRLAVAGHKVAADRDFATAAAAALCIASGANIIRAHNVGAAADAAKVADALKQHARPSGMQQPVS